MTNFIPVNAIVNASEIEVRPESDKIRTLQKSYASIHYVIDPSQASQLTSGTAKALNAVAYALQCYSRTHFDSDEEFHLEMLDGNTVVKIPQDYLMQLMAYSSRDVENFRKIIKQLKQFNVSWDNEKKGKKAKYGFEQIFVGAEVSDAIVRFTITPKTRHKFVSKDQVAAIDINLLHHSLGGRYAIWLYELLQSYMQQSESTQYHVFEIPDDELRNALRNPADPKDPNKLMYGSPGDFLARILSSAKDEINNDKSPKKKVRTYNPEKQLYYYDEESELCWLKSHATKKSFATRGYVYLKFAELKESEQEVAKAIIDKVTEERLAKVEDDDDVVSDLGFKILDINYKRKSGTVIWYISVEQTEDLSLHLVGSEHSREVTKIAEQLRQWKVSSFKSILREIKDEKDIAYVSFNIEKVKESLKRGKSENKPITNIAGYFLKCHSDNKSIFESSWDEILKKRELDKLNEKKRQNEILRQQKELIRKNYISKKTLLFIDKCSFEELEAIYAQFIVSVSQQGIGLARKLSSLSYNDFVLLDDPAYIARFRSYIWKEVIKMDESEIQKHVRRGSIAIEIN